MYGAAATAIRSRRSGSAVSSRNTASMYSSGVSPSLTAWLAISRVFWLAAIATIGFGSIVAQHSEHVLKRRQPVLGSVVSNFTGFLARRPWFASGTLSTPAMTVGHPDKP